MMANPLLAFIIAGISVIAIASASVVSVIVRLL
jgi:hypothetical protein